MARTPARALRQPLRTRLALVALLGAGALTAGCSASGRPAGTPPPPSPRHVFAAPTEGAPLWTLAVADPVPPAPIPLTRVSPTTGSDDVPAAGRTAGLVAGDPPSAHSRYARPRHAVPDPAPQRPPGHPPGVCDLAEQYGKWPRGSSQAAACHAVYG
ncbi:hypothetical protein ABIA33_001255 [Streptacidiphilus sp. MAP12-16]|uniref:hypothetical protein n=1 Tax=Streptacidiphilus sp. MAP12-16 TaxID=3156300 RepID=UPI003516438D